MVGSEIFLPECGVINYGVLQDGMLKDGMLKDGATCGHALKLSGLCRDRTYDPVIKSHLLYQLS